MLIIIIIIIIIIVIYILPPCYVIDRFLNSKLIQVTCTSPFPLFFPLCSSFRIEWMVWLIDWFFFPVRVVVPWIKQPAQNKGPSFYLSINHSIKQARWWTSFQRKNPVWIYMMVQQMHEDMITMIIMLLMRRMIPATKAVTMSAEIPSMYVHPYPLLCNHLSLPKENDFRKEEEHASLLFSSLLLYDDDADNDDNSNDIAFFNILYALLFLLINGSYNYYY